MRIVHVIGGINPSGGGPQTVVASLASAQAALGHDVTILHHTLDHLMETIPALLTQIEGSERVRLHRIRPPNRLEQILTRRLVSDCAECIQNHDVVQLHGVWDAILRSSAAAARKLRVPYIVTPHGMLDPWSLQQSKWKKGIVMLISTSAMLQRAGAIHALNEAERIGISKLGLETRVEVIPNGVFSSILAKLPARGGFRARQPQFTDKRIVLFLSRLHWKKGLDLLVNAMAKVVAKVPDAALVIAGPDDGALSALQQQIRGRQLEASVHIVGPIYAEGKSELLVDADAFCLPSRQEGFSMAILEALAAQVPVVISHQCNFPEVGRANAGVVTQLSDAAVADALIEVLSNVEKSMEMGRRGRELVLRDYTWERIVVRTIELYNSVTARL